MGDHCWKVLVPCLFFRKDILHDFRVLLEDR
jgi:hypothetical protein